MVSFNFGIAAYVLFLTFVLGACLGSFADCLAMRLLSGKSVSFGRSHCDSCGHVLGVLDLFPVVSWLLLRGKCRYCKMPISAESSLVELISGIACCIIVSHFGLSVVSLRTVFLCVVLLTASLTDLRGWVIPDTLQLAGCLIFLGTVIFLPKPLHQLGCGVVLGMILGGGMLFLTLMFERWTGKVSLGGGDIKLFFVTGLYLNSVWEVLFYLILSCLFGLCFAALRRTSRIPFGPAIAAACFFMILYGETWTRWYIGLF